MDKIYKALSDNNRRRILKLLREKDWSVNELLGSFKITQATLSSHLAILKKAKLVESRVEGKKRIYRLVGDGLLRVIEDLSFKEGGIASRRVNL